MENFIERNQQKKEKKGKWMCIWKIVLGLKSVHMSSFRCLHRPVVFFYILFCRELRLLYLSRTKRKNWKRGGARSFASGSLLRLLVVVSRGATMSQDQVGYSIFPSFACIDGTGYFPLIYLSKSVSKSATLVAACWRTVSPSIPTYLLYGRYVSIRPKPS